MLGYHVFYHLCLLDVASQVQDHADEEVSQLFELIGVQVGSWIHKLREFILNDVSEHIALHHSQ